MKISREDIVKIGDKFLEHDNVYHVSIKLHFNDGSEINYSKYVNDEE